MVDSELAEAAATSGGEDVNGSKQAACHECRRSKVKCVRPLNADACKKCANAGVECVVPKYHVGRYKGVKNKRSGLDKAIHQVEEAVKKARTHGSAIHDKHTEALQKLLAESKTAPPKDTAEDRAEERRKHTSRDTASGPLLNYSPASSQVGLELQGSNIQPFIQPSENGEDVTVNNANNPLQLLAIASAIPETPAESSPQLMSSGLSPGATTAVIVDEDETQDFFRPMMSRLDVGKDLDPVELGLVSEPEVQVLFEFFHQNLAHTRWGLDRKVHTSKFVRSRSAYLFTSILVCASLFLTDTAALSIRLSSHCKYLARRVTSGGYRSLEIVLAYMINIPWMQPGKTWAVDDETCYYLSTAMTIAIDLSLNKIVTPSSTMRSQGAMEKTAPADCIEAQRALNMDCHIDVDPSSTFGRRLLRARERTWLALFTLDRGVCLARGRPWTVPTGPLIETCDAWHVSDIADQEDGSLVAAAVLRRDFGNLVTSIRTTCDNHRFVGGGGGGANIVKVMREKVEGFFTQWYQTWTYQIQRNDGTLPPYVEILVSHGKLSAYCNVINHPTASMEVKQFFRAAGLTAALHVIRVAVQNESKLHSIPNNSVIMVSFAACFVLGLSTTRRGGQIYIVDHVKKSINEAADVLERIGSFPAHRKGASTLFGKHIKRIVKLHTAPVGTNNAVRSANENDPSNATITSNSDFITVPYTLQPISDEMENSFPGFDCLTDDQLLAAIQNSNHDIETFNAGLQNDDSLFMDWLDWPNLT